MATKYEVEEQDITTTGKKRNKDDHFAMSRTEELLELLKEGTFRTK